MKIAILTEEVLIFSERLEKFNKLFRKNVTNDNIKSHKEPEFHPLFRRYNFGKTKRGQTDPSSRLFRVKSGKRSGIFSLFIYSWKIYSLFCQYLEIIYS